MVVTPDGTLALVANSVDQVKDGEGWKSVPDNKVYVIDLTARPPQQIATIETDKQPSGMAINKKGDLVLVGNRADKSVSVLSVAGKEVKLIGSVETGDTVAAVAFTPDGAHALAVKQIANKVAWLSVDGQKVSYDKQDVTVGVGPYNVEVTPDGKIAIVVNQRSGSDGGADTVSVIDIAVSPPRVVDHVVVGEGPEGLAISPKGNLAVAILIRNSNGDHKVPYYHKNGAIALLKIDGKKITKVGEVEIGATPEAVAFSPDGKFLYVGNFTDADMSIFKVEGTKLIEVGKRMKVEGHPAAMRASSSR
jgi:DNA-binding beta-propeller fold protein YncE